MNSSFLSAGMMPLGHRLLGQVFAPLSQGRAANVTMLQDGVDEQGANDVGAQRGGEGGGAGLAQILFITGGDHFLIRGGSGPAGAFFIGFISHAVGAAVDQVRHFLGLGQVIPPLQSGFPVGAVGADDEAVAVGNDGAGGGQLSRVAFGGDGIKGNVLILLFHAGDYVACLPAHEDAGTHGVHLRNELLVGGGEAFHVEQAFLAQLVEILQEFAESGGVGGGYNLAVFNVVQTGDSPG